MRRSPSVKFPLWLTVGALLTFCSPTWFSSARAAEQVGERVRIDPQALPAPFATPSSARSPRVVSPPESPALEVPAGYKAAILARGLRGPRNLAVAPDGGILVVLQKAGSVVRLGESGPEPVASGLDEPFGIAFQDGILHIADLQGVWRIEANGAKRMLTPAGALGDGGGHVTRSLVFSPDGQRFYVGIGSRSNIGEDPEPRASIMEFRRDGSGGRVYASGLRNPVGIGFRPGSRPGSQELWTVVNERDSLGDQLVPDYLTQVVEGGFYGWPYSYIGHHPQPGYAERRPDLVRSARVPDVLFRSHSAPIGLAFWRGDGFAALRGSWNSGVPTGYQIARIRFKEGTPAGGYEIFATGFRSGDAPDGRAQVWGRPAGLAVSADDALLIADDTSGTVWKISGRD